MILPNCSTFRHRRLEQPGDTLTALIDNADAAGAVSALAALGLAWVSVPSTVWKRRYERNKSNFNTLERLEGETYKNRATDSMYTLASALKLPVDSPIGRGDRLLVRTLAIDLLSDEQQRVGEEVSDRWIESVGRFARSASRQRHLPLRSFLQTNHLGVIRDAALVEPFVIRRLASSDIHIRSEKGELAIWGLALADLARFYNSLARQQREAISFERKPPEFQENGIVLYPPGRMVRPPLSVLDMILRSLRLRLWRYLSAKRRTKRIANQVTVQVVAPTRAPSL